MNRRWISIVVFIIIVSIFRNDWVGNVFGREDTTSGFLTSLFWLGVFFTVASSLFKKQTIEEKQDYIKQTPIAKKKIDEYADDPGIYDDDPDEYAFDPNDYKLED